MSHPKNALLNARLHPWNSHPDWGRPRSQPQGLLPPPGQFSTKEATLPTSLTLEDPCLRLNRMRTEACRMVRLGFPISLLGAASHPVNANYQNPGVTACWQVGSLPNVGSGGWKCS